MAKGGHAWPGGDMCGKGGMYARGACVAGGTTTAADGTHPTGVHSRYHLSQDLSERVSYFCHKGDCS